MRQVLEAANETGSGLLRRYRTVLSQAWRRRHQLAGPAYQDDEVAFLPAALSLQHTPPHPAPRRLAWLVMIIFVAALLWACLGRIDTVAVASGRIVVHDRSKLVQPLERSVVRRILVRDGDQVRTGQPLLELDATAARSDSAALREQTRSSHADALRARALLLALQQPGLPPSNLVLDAGRAGAITPGWSNADRLLAQAQLHAEWQDIDARLGRLSSELVRRQAEAATARQVVAKTEATLPMARQREDDFKVLLNQGFIASHAGQDRTRERVEQERDLVTQQARLQEALAALAESSSNRAAYLAETRRSLQEREAQALLRFQQANQEYTKAAQREAGTVLVAPVEGTVQQLAVHTVGGVVVEAQVLMVIVPQAEPDAPLVAEVSLENKDVGFISAGQLAELKLETFPYTRYGTVAAVVDLVSSDAVADDKRGAVFPARLRLQKGHLEVDGRPVRLGPGMNVTAEIKIGQQTVMGYLLGPVLRTRSESLRER